MPMAGCHKSRGKYIVTEEALLDEWAEEVQQQAAEAGGLF